MASAAPGIKMGCWPPRNPIKPVCRMASAVNGTRPGGCSANIRWFTAPAFSGRGTKMAGCKWSFPPFAANSSATAVSGFGTAPCFRNISVFTVNMSVIAEYRAAAAKDKSFPKLRGHRRNRCRILRPGKNIFSASSCLRCWPDQTAAKRGNGCEENRGPDRAFAGTLQTRA